MQVDDIGVTNHRDYWSSRINLAADGQGALPWQTEVGRFLTLER